MGLAGARNSAVTGLQAQSTNISISADNIANASTPGYKALTGQFSTLVTGGNSSAGYSSGGVSINAKTFVETQGLIESTGRVTDLAISGTGFFAVQDASSSLFLTRAGSFDIDNAGQLVNAAGYTLLGWPLDNDGLRPGQTGNANTTAAESTDSLVTVDTDSASGAAAATTTVSVGMNLNAGEATFQGATLIMEPVSTGENADVSQSDILVPNTTGMTEGDRISFTANGVKSTFEYGGFATSGDLAEDAIFGASTATTVFTTGSTLANGDKFKITTTSSGAATFTFQQSSPDTGSGQFNSLETLATAINNQAGLTARVSGTKLYVSSNDATEAITFSDVTGSNLHNELGFGDEPAAASGVNRWNTFSGLSTLVNATNDLGATINNPSSGATIDIYAADPEQILTVTKEHSLAAIDLVSNENSNIASTGVIVPVNGTDSMTVNTSTITFADSSGTDTFTYGGIANTVDITATNIWGASTASGGGVADTTDRFTVAGGLPDGEVLTFGDGTNTVAVTFDDEATSALAAGEFNSLITLATAISRTGDFTARVENNILYVASADADRAVVVNASSIADAALATALGGSWGVSGADVEGVAASGGATRFASLAELHALINAGSTNITSTLSNASANTKLELVQGGGEDITVGGTANEDLLSELGLAAGDTLDDFFTEFGIDDTIIASADTATIAITYNPADDTKNMAGGTVTPHFPRNIQIFDSLGTGHDFRLGFLKIGTNEWAVELFSLNPSEVSAGTDGLIASGTMVFNGDGSLRSISSGLVGDINISWTTGATTSTINLDLGTAGSIAGTVGATAIGLTDGVRQFDAAYNVEFIEQNGVAAGQFKGVTVGDDGTVFANFSNGEIKAIYQLPIVTVANQNALQAETGNVFSVTQDSGDVNLKVAGQGGAGTIVAASLEGSTSDIAEELTRTIGIQSNYNANATLISTVRDMEEELNRRL